MMKVTSVSFDKGTVRLGRQVEIRQRGSLAVSESRDLLVVRSIRGAYNLDGTLAGDTVRLWGEGDDIPDSVPQICPERSVVKVCDDEVVWGGCLDGHYGHFLTESVSRLWPLLPGGKLEGLPVVFTTPGPWPFVCEWLDAFGVLTVHLPERGAVRFSRMFVPEPALRLRAWISPEIRDIHLHARRGLGIRHKRGGQDEGVLWLSRSGLARHRVAHDEVLLEWLLERHATIIKPETMTLAEQVALIEASDAVSGVVGSAFHTILMASRPPSSLYVCPPRIVSTFPAQDQLLGGDGTFVQAATVLLGNDSEKAGFPGAHRLMIPEILRALSRTILPNLLDDPRISAVAFPERLWSKVGTPVESDLETALARVFLDPANIGARMDLGARFEAEHVNRCALAQFTMVANLTHDYAYAPLRAARLLHRSGQFAEASAMAKQVLQIQPDLKEATCYITES